MTPKNGGVEFETDKEHEDEYRSLRQLADHIPGIRREDQCRPGRGQGAEDGRSKQDTRRQFPDNRGLPYSAHQPAAPPRKDEDGGDRRKRFHGRGKYS
jgi:hypothetical protein